MIKITNDFIKIGSQGLNVMKALTRKVLLEINNKLTEIGICNLHKTHNVFSAALEAHGSDIEMLLIKSVLPLFTKMTRMFQAVATLIHVLYDEMFFPCSIGNKCGQDHLQLI